MVDSPNFSFNTIEALVEQVFLYPDLYDKSRLDNKRRNTRAKLWNQIATTLGIGGLDAQTCKIEWNKQRESYLYYKNTNASNPRPSLEQELLFEKMRFLDNNETLPPSYENRQQGYGIQQPRNENHQQGNGNQQEGPQNIPDVKPTLVLPLQSGNESMHAYELTVFTTEVRTELENLPLGYQIRAQFEILDVLSKYKNMAYFATGGTGSSDKLDAEKKEILTRLANSRKEDVKALAKKTNRDKDEINRIKREIHSQSVERGVAECCRVEKAYATRREQLARTHERLLQLLLKHREQELLELERLCGGAPEG